MLAFALTALLPCAAATFIGCFSQIPPGPNPPTYDEGDCSNLCRIGSGGYTYSSTRRGSTSSVPECQCFNLFPGTNSLADCTSDNWRTYEAGSYNTWGCVPQSSFQANTTRSANNPNDCFDTCSGQSTKWSVLWADGNNGYNCWCTTDGIPNGLSAQACHADSYYMFTSNS